MTTTFTVAKNIAKEINKTFGVNEAKAFTAKEMAEKGYGEAAGVIWEGGPFEWTLGLGAAFEQEFADEMSAFGVSSGTFSDKEYYRIPEGFEVEPYNSSVLSVYKD